VLKPWEAVRTRDAVATVLAVAPLQRDVGIVATLTREIAAARAGSITVRVVEAQFPTLSQEATLNEYGPSRPASLKCASSWLPVNVVGKLVQLPVPAGAISTDPPATPDSLSLASATRAVGSLGFTGSRLTTGGASSMCTLTELVPELWLPCGSTALFHAVQVTVFTPSPTTVKPAAEYVCAAAPLTPQLIPPRPDGPVLGVASTVTA
jgi:hypothetical protein